MSNTGENRRVGRAHSPSRQISFVQWVSNRYESRPGTLTVSTDLAEDKRERRLSTYVRVNGRDVFDDKPSSWQYAPPEGSGATLLKILCPMR